MRTTNWEGSSRKRASLGAKVGAASGVAIALSVLLATLAIHRPAPSGAITFLASFVLIACGLALAGVIVGEAAARTSSLFLGALIGALVTIATCWIVAWPLPLASYYAGGLRDYCAFTLTSGALTGSLAALSTRRLSDDHQSMISVREVLWLTTSAAAFLATLRAVAGSAAPRY